MTFCGILVKSRLDDDTHNIVLIGFLSSMLAFAISEVYQYWYFFVYESFGRLSIVAHLNFPHDVFGKLERSVGP